MAVDYPKVKQYALELESALARFAPVDPEFAALERTLTPWIDAVLKGSAKLPFKEVPCGWYLVEGKMAEPKFDELANAYSKFAFFAEGRDDDELRHFFHRLETDPKFAARMDSNELVWWEKIWNFFSRMPGWQIVWKVWVRLKRIGRRLRGD